jgi:hypothetical protein
VWWAPLCVLGALAAASPLPQPASVAALTSTLQIEIEATPVPLDPRAPSATILGDFRYAGGLVLTSRQTDRLHELSDLIITGSNRFAAVTDAGAFLEGRLVLDAAGRLVGVTDATLTQLKGEDGAPLEGLHADAEGLALLANGDRLVSFERRHRILLYPADGGLPRPVPSPAAWFPSNGGIEALTADPDAGADAYVAGAEDSGDTWTCRVSAPCVRRRTLDKPGEFGLVSMNRLPDGLTAYLLRAFDPIRRSRITLEILRGATLISRMDLSAPLTVDNFEGMTSVSHADGRRRFYLISDDNNRASERTLLFAFDWRRPR